MLHRRKWMTLPLLSSIAWALVGSTAQAQPPPGRETAIEWASEGLAASLRGDFATCTRLYRQAFAADGSPEYLYSAARCEHQAGQCEVAAADYTTLLQLPDVPASLRVKGEFHAEQAKTALREGRCVPVQSKPPSHARTHAAIALAGAGGTALLGATALWLQARTDQRALDGYRDAAGQFRPDTIGPTAALDAQTSINERTVAAWSLLGAGALAGVIATWLLLTESPGAAEASVQPSGAGIAGRF